jgi:exonuclease III
MIIVVRVSPASRAMYAPTVSVGYRAGGLRRRLAWGNIVERRRHAQARYIEAAVHGVLIASLYAPNGNPQPGPKFSLKLAWLDRLLAHAAELLAAGVPVVLAGDYNVVPTDRDIYPTRSYAKNALLRPESRARFARLLDQGWVDAVRTLLPTINLSLLGLARLPAKVADILRIKLASDRRGN